MTWTTRPRTEGAGGLACWRVGSGPALVLVHGVGLRAEAWAAVVPYLAAEFSVFAVDMPGHGGSRYQNETDLKDYVTRIGAFVASLDAPVYVAGHSMGAMIALDLASRTSLPVSGVAALNAIYRRTPEASRAVRARAKDLAAGQTASPDNTLARWFGDPPTDTHAAAARACRDWLTHGDKKGYAATYTVFAHHDGPADARLKSLHCPALFQTGTRDPNSTPEMSQNMASLAPEGVSNSVPGAAHMMPMTHPKTVAQALLSTFRPRQER